MGIGQTDGARVNPAEQIFKNHFQSSWIVASTREHKYNRQLQS